MPPFVVLPAPTLSASALSSAIALSCESWSAYWRAHQRIHASAEIRKNVTRYYDNYSSGNNGCISNNFSHNIYPNYQTK